MPTLLGMNPAQIAEFRRLLMYLFPGTPWGVAPWQMRERFDQLLRMEGVQHDPKRRFVDQEIGL